MTCRTALVAVMGVIATVVSFSCDPIQSDAVAALGPEAPGVREGPEHRPGQPCVTCHGSSGPGSPQWSVAGTIYRVKGEPAPLGGATVDLVDSTGSTFRATTNSVGNFYVEQSRWAPVFPMRTSITYGGKVVEMKTHIGRDGSCGNCHRAPAGPMSAGPVFFAATAADLLGTP